MLAGRRVVLGVTGGIAAYKAVEVCRRLVDDGAFVSPVLTDGALRFVGATTFSALASEPVRTELWDAADPIPHTRLGQGADVIVVAPATARLLSDYASGRSADLLTATLIATEAPVVVCPAMHTEMWEHPAVQENVATLRRRGVHIVDPEQGRLAGGDLGTGRLAAPEAIVAAVRAALAAPDLEGLQVVVTAGGTREALDPVRYLGNRSSGRQGHAIAQAAAERGGDVTLVTAAGLATPPGVRRVVLAGVGAHAQPQSPGQPQHRGVGLFLQGGDHARAGQTSAAQHVQRCRIATGLLDHSTEKKQHGIAERIRFLQGADGVEHEAKPAR